MDGSASCACDDESFAGWAALGCIKVAGKMEIPVNSEVIGVDLSSQEVLWRYEHPQRHFPF